MIAFSLKDFILLCGLFISLFDCVIIVFEVIMLLFDILESWKRSLTFFQYSAMRQFFLITVNSVVRVVRILTTEFRVFSFMYYILAGFVASNVFSNILDMDSFLGYTAAFDYWFIFIVASIVSMVLYFGI